MSFLQNEYVRIVRKDVFTSFQSAHESYQSALFSSAVTSASCIFSSCEIYYFAVRFIRTHFISTLFARSTLYCILTRNFDQVASKYTARLIEFCITKAYRGHDRQKKPHFLRAIKHSNLNWFSVSTFILVGISRFKILYRFSSRVLAFILRWW